MRRERTVVALVTALLALVVSGCGGGGSHTTSAPSYVHQLCTAITGFETTVSSGESSLNQLSAGSNPDLGKLKTQVTAFFTAAATASKKAQTQIEAAGTPDVTNGAKIQAALVSAFQKFTAGFATAAKASTTVTTASQQKFGTAVKALQAQLEQTSEGVSTSLNGLGTSLHAAALEDSSCAAIDGTSGA